MLGAAQQAGPGRRQGRGCWREAAAVLQGSSRESGEDSASIKGHENMNSAEVWPWHVWKLRPSLFCVQLLYLVSSSFSITAAGAPHPARNSY